MSNTKEVYISTADRVVRYCLVIISLSALAFLYFSMYFSQDIAFKLFGHKTEAMFDFWSFQHIMSGFILARIICYLVIDTKERPWNGEAAYYVLIFLAVLWEWVETLMEIGNYGKNIMLWKNGVEHWSNRIIADPSLMVFGMYLWRRYRKYFWPVASTVFIWLILNSLMSNCMYIQNRLSLFF